MTGVQTCALPISLEARGYRHDPAFLDRLAQKFPEVDLELEVAAAVDWLEQPRNSKRPCSKGFLKNWVMKADADRKVQEAAPRNGTLNGPYHAPITQQGRNPGPPDLPRLEAPMERVAPAERDHFLAERRAVPLAQKLAGIKGRT